MSEFVYMLIPDQSSWEDSVIILNVDKAISLSIQYPLCRVEIFKKGNKDSGYVPTYKFYKKGYIH
jgi:hypothetical protein